VRRLPSPARGARGVGVPVRRGCVARLGVETNLNLAGHVMVGHKGPLRTDVPTEDDAYRRLIDKDARPPALGAVHGPVDDIAADPGFEHGLGDGPIEQVVFTRLEVTYGSVKSRPKPARVRSNRPSAAGRQVAAEGSNANCRLSGPIWRTDSSSRSHRCTTSRVKGVLDCRWLAWFGSPGRQSWQHNHGGAGDGQGGSARSARQNPRPGTGAAGGVPHRPGLRTRTLARRLTMPRVPVPDAGLKAAL
jgi:hypothetical protein